MNTYSVGRLPSPNKVLVKAIQELRRQYPNLNKAKLHIMLRPLCAQQNIPLPSVSTIGRIIAGAPDKMRHAPTRLNPKGRPKPLRIKRKTRKPKGFKHQPMEVIACDTVVRLRDGLRRYLFTFIDPHSRFAIALAATTQSSRQATMPSTLSCQKYRP